MVTNGVFDHATQQAVPLVSERAIGQHYGGRPGPAGQRCDTMLEDFHVPGLQHPFNGAVHDLSTGFAGHHETGADLAQFDGIGDLQDAVENADTGIGDIEYLGRGAYSQAIGHRTGRGRFQVFAADGPVDQHADLVGRDAGCRKRLATGPGRPFRKREIRIPVTTFFNAGQLLKLSRLQMQSVV